MGHFKSNRQFKSILSIKSITFFSKFKRQKKLFLTKFLNFGEILVCSQKSFRSLTADVWVCVCVKERERERYREVEREREREREGWNEVANEVQPKQVFNFFLRFWPLVSPPLSLSPSQRLSLVFLFSFFLSNPPFKAKAKCYRSHAPINIYVLIWSFAASKTQFLLN